MSNRIAVVGTGYVGLTTGACLAHLGLRVVCADIDANKMLQVLRIGGRPVDGKIRRRGDEHPAHRTQAARAQ